MEHPVQWLCAPLSLEHVLRAMFAANSYLDRSSFRHSRLCSCSDRIGLGPAAIDRTQISTSCAIATLPTIS